MLSSSSAHARHVRSGDAPASRTGGGNATAAGHRTTQLAQELAEARTREQHLRSALAAEAAGRAEDVRRLEMKLKLNGAAHRVKEVESKARALQGRLREADAELETAAETEAALRHELAVYAQMEQWSRDPSLRAAAESVVELRELRAANENHRRHRDSAESRVEELTERVQRLTDYVEQLERVQAASDEETRLLQDRAIEGEAALQENQALRGEVGDLEARLQSTQTEIGDVRPRLEEAEAEAARHRTAWQEARRVSEEAQSAAAEASERVATLLDELAAARHAEDSSRRQADERDVELAALRRQQAQWEDEQRDLHELRHRAQEGEQEIVSLKERVSGLTTLHQQLQEQHGLDTASVQDLRRRLDDSEKGKAVLAQELSLLQRDFDTLESDLGRRSLAAEIEAEALAARLKETQVTCRRFDEENANLRAKCAALRQGADAAARRAAKIVVASRTTTEGVAQHQPTPARPLSARQPNDPAVAAVSKPKSGAAPFNVQRPSFLRRYDSVGEGPAGVGTDGFSPPRSSTGDRTFELSPASER